MESYEVNKIVEWLEITPQQFDILMTIYKLQLNGEDTGKILIRIWKIHAEVKSIWSIKGTS